MVDFRGEAADGETETVVGVLLKNAAEVIAQCRRHGCWGFENDGRTLYFPNV